MPVSSGATRVSNRPGGKPPAPARRRGRDAARRPARGRVRGRYIWRNDFHPGGPAGHSAGRNLCPFARTSWPIAVVPIASWPYEAVAKLLRQRALSGPPSHRWLSRLRAPPGYPVEAANGVEEPHADLPANPSTSEHGWSRARTSSSCGGQAACVPSWTPVSRRPDEYVTFAAASYLGLRLTLRRSTPMCTPTTCSGGPLLARGGRGRLRASTASAGARCPFTPRATDGERIELGQYASSRCSTRPATRPRVSRSWSPTAARARALVRAHRRYALLRRHGTHQSSPYERENGARTAASTSRGAPRPCPTRSRSSLAHFAGSACGAGLSGKPTQHHRLRARLQPGLLARDEAAFVDDVRTIPPRRPRCGEVRAVQSRAVAGRATMVAVRSRRARPPGSRANWRQFSLLVLVNAFVGAMVGLERTVLPLLAEREFGSRRERGVSRSSSPSASSRRSRTSSPAGSRDRIGRKHVLVAGWLFASRCRSCDVGAVVGLDRRRERAARGQPGPHLVDDGDHEDRSRRARAARARDGAERVRRLPRGGGVARSRPGTSRRATDCDPSRSYLGIAFVAVWASRCRCSSSATPRARARRREARTAKRCGPLRSANVLARRSCSRRSSARARPAS